MDSVTLHLQELYAFALPLTRELVIAGNALQRREGLFVVLEDEQGTRGVGEIAPLPGFHHETPEDCLALLSQHRELLKRLPVDPSSTGEMLLSEGLRTLSPFRQCPSVHFGLSMAIINLLADAHGTTPAHILNQEPRVDLRINGLVTAPHDTWNTEAQMLVEAGYRALKIKVGRGDIRKESHALRALQERHGSEINYVLDGNRGWSLEEADVFFDSVDMALISYGEELLADPYELETLSKRLTLPMALDETLFDADAHKQLIQDWSGIFVLKPDRIQGGLENCLALATLAQQRGSHTIVSSAFNTPLGLSFLAQLAAALHCPHAGLDTGRWLPDVDGRFCISNGQIHIPHCWINDLENFASYIEKVW